MKKIVFVILILLSFNGFSQKFFQMNDFPGSQRSRNSGFSIGDKGYLVFGRSGNLEFKELYEYNPIADSWLVKADFPGVARFNAFAFNIDSLGFAGGGYTGRTSVFDFYQYNPITDAWTLKTTYPGSESVANIAIGLNGKGYVGAGTAVGASPSSIEFFEYDPLTNAWTPKANLPFGGRTGAITFTLNNLIFAGLGHNGSVNFNDLWAYDPVINAWSQKASFPGLSRIQSSVFMLNGTAVVGGGHRLGAGTPLLDYYTYDATNDSWSLLIQLIPGPTSSTGADFTVNNVGYLACGFDSTTADVKKVWALRPIPTALNKNNTEDNKISIFPNPTSNQISVRFDYDINENSHFIIFNSLGEKVLEGVVTSNENKIDCSELQVGNYFLQVISKNKTNSKKFIVSR